MMLGFIDGLMSLFSVDAEIARLRNQSSHVLVEYQKAKVKIADAKRKCNDVVAHTVADFEKVKQNRFDKTLDAAHQLNFRAKQEEDELRDEYYEAMDRIAKKREAVDELVGQVSTLDSAKYAFE
jgi:Zn-dependent oligopeptidase